MISSLVLVAFVLIAASLTAMLFSTEGTETTWRLMGILAHLFAAVSVAQYLIWPAQGSAFKLTAGVIVVAALSLAYFAYRSYHVLRSR